MPRCLLPLAPSITTTSRAMSAAPPPPYMHPPPPPIVYEEEWDHVVMPPDTNPYKGKVSAMIKRVSNGRMINPSLRSSKHTVYCPKEDDCSHGCARACARQHLGRLRAFSVTGSRWTRNPPPLQPTPPPAPEPPAPPFAPLSICQDTCTPGTIPDHRKGQCRDGGYNSYSPTLCTYATSVRRLPFRRECRRR